MGQSIKKLLETLQNSREVTIRGIVKRVTGMARYATVNSPESEYVKVAFHDGSGMYFALDNPPVFYYERKLGAAEGIADEQIGKDEMITWQGSDYKPANINDYQFVKELLIGTIHEIEGEVRFSDYEAEDGSVISLGWNLFEGKRDDVFAKPLSDSEIYQ